MQTNNASKIKPIISRKIEWQNLSFSSVSEVKIAQALDRVGVLFFPNCRGRLNTDQGRRNRECDFLICYEGVWAILEVDGEPFHPASRAAEDHKRDGFFLDHGVWVHRFDANECFQYPDDVVRQFLQRLNPHSAPSTVTWQNEGDFDLSEVSFRGKNNEPTARNSCAKPRPLGDSSRDNR